VQNTVDDQVPANI